MKKIQLITMLLLLSSYIGRTQVKDISFTLSPAAEYTWWDDKAGLEDNTMVGGKLGFGFGEFVEIRGIYLQSLDQKTDFSNYGISTFDADLFNSQNVTIKRYGGEFKANFSTKGIKPYFTLGAGVQNIDIENTGDYEQVYGSLGLGVKFNISKRVVFAIEGKNTTYKFNSGVSLLSEDDKIDFGVTDADFDSERLSNWSLQGSLQFYLGGRKPGTLSDLDKAYLQKFKGGFKGLQWVIEPSLVYVDFADESLFRDTYWLGGYVGLDLNEYIGVRAFYFQSTQNEEISTDFDKMAMYGGEFRARLNDGNGVTPYLILGGGYLNPNNNYVPVANEDGSFSTVEGGEFATGGLGLNIPLSKHVLITGGARAMLTSGGNATDITTTDDIQTHVFYNAGIKFTIGKRSKAPSTVYQENLDRELTAQEQANNEKLEQLKNEYQTKIDSLENDLKKAYEAKDVEKAVEILEEKKQVEEALKQVEEVEKVQEKVIKETATPTQNVGATPKTKIVVPDNKEVTIPKTETATPNSQEKSKLIQMTPLEFESLIDRILKGLDIEDTNIVPTVIDKNKSMQMENNSKLQDEKIKQLNNRIDVLEKLLLQLNTKQGTSYNTPKSVVPNDDGRVNHMNSVILDKLDDLNRKIDANANQIQADKNRAQTVIINPNQNVDDEVKVTAIDENGEVINSFALEQDENNSDETLIVEEKETSLKYKNASAILGFNYGGASTANIGFRLHYDINKTKLEFMPEAYVGFGEADAWSLAGNVIYPMAIKSEKFKPYAGAGLGFGNFVDGVTGFYNIVLGSKLPVLHKNLYVDYTMRNSFDYNQIAVGFNFQF